MNISGYMLRFSCELDFITIIEEPFSYKFTKKIHTPSTLGNKGDLTKHLISYPHHLSN